MTGEPNLPRPLAARPTTAADIAARLDRLPASPRLWTLVLLLSLGGFFEIYDLIVTPYIAPGLARSGLLATTTATFFGLQGIAGFIAATFAGLFVGTFGLGFLPDRYGRRAVFTGALLWYCAASAVMAFQSQAEGLLFWRFVTGIGVGIEIVTIDVYITELVPQHLRGRAMAFNQAVMFTAAPVAALLSYVLGPTAYAGIEGWRWVVLVGCFGAVAVWFIRRAIPESPRWLADRGRIAAADRIVAAIEARVQREHGAPLPAPQAARATAAAERTRAGTGTTPYRTRIAMLVVFNLFQAIGYYGFANWVPTLLIGQGITVTKSLGYAFIIAFALPIGPLLALGVADRVERKWLIVGSALAVVVFGLAFGQLREPWLLTVCGVLISLAGQLISVSYHAYQAELFPTAVRARASGLVYSASRVGAMLSGFLIAWLLRQHGVAGVFVGITGCMIVVALAIAVFGPRTNGVPLEDLSR